MQDYSGEDGSLEDSFQDPPFNVEMGKESESSDDEEEEKGEKQAFGRKQISDVEYTSRGFDFAGVSTNQSQNDMYGGSRRSSSVRGTPRRNMTKKSQMTKGKCKAIGGTAKSNSNGYNKNYNSYRESQRDLIGLSSSDEDDKEVSPTQSSLSDDSTLDTDHDNLFTTVHNAKGTHGDDRRINDDEREVPDKDMEVDSNEESTGDKKGEKEGVEEAHGRKTYSNLDNAARSTKSSSKDGNLPADQAQLRDMVHEATAEIMTIVEGQHQKKAEKIMKKVRNNLHDYARRMNEDLEEAKAGPAEIGTF